MHLAARGCAAASDVAIESASARNRACLITPRAQILQPVLGAVPPVAAELLTGQAGVQVGGVSGAGKAARPLERLCMRKQVQSLIMPSHAAAELLTRQNVE